eukprot:CAMPEP_0197640882 /NCGR_PEP_ID=MMETSP1338-20131121/15014_1 /TAXON_ID=43686 ORGANISM="Pelagodinium beii, Strain RCC1491" /NCGR_SAMPLE_ID=MMETSP1338 /ASSEMBLY_ACC=CAM_ASM_000754 /LENGTH=218 /DNA_ID=CAMNT_0043213765 /DNA_START=283 /DNA_END=936 /DNA_ORIENTATION=-
MHYGKNDRFRLNQSLVEVPYDSTESGQSELRLEQKAMHRYRWRKRFMHSRNAVLSYAVADINEKTGEISEPAGAVLRRLRTLYDDVWHGIFYERQKYFRDLRHGKRWEDSFKNRVKRFQTQRRRKQAFEDAWNDWLRKSGRSLKLTQQMVYNGPKLASLLTPELDEKSDPKAIKKIAPTKDEANSRSYRKSWNALGGTYDMLPGNWNTDGIDNVHKVW